MYKYSNHNGLFCVSFLEAVSNNCLKFSIYLFFHCVFYKQSVMWFTADFLNNIQKVVTLSFLQLY